MKTPAENLPKELPASEPNSPAAASEHPSGGALPPPVTNIQFPEMFQPEGGFASGPSAPTALSGLPDTISPQKMADEAAAGKYGYSWGNPNDK